MAENIIGYEFNEILRLNAGSPASWYVLSLRSQSLMIDNLGSPGVYFNFNGAAVNGSTSGFVPNQQFRVFDVRTGSVSIYAETGSPNVQVISLRDTNTS